VFVVSVDVQSYIDRQKSPQKEIIIELRRIFHKTCPVLKEKRRWGVITYSNSKFYIASMKNRVHVGFSIIGLSKDEIGFFEGSGKTMRHLKIFGLEEINEKRLVDLIRLVDMKASCVPE
jgi:hypothetical protein